jgi:hypothetical protein
MSPDKANPALRARDGQCRLASCLYREGNPEEDKLAGWGCSPANFMRLDGLGADQDCDQ